MNDFRYSVRCRFTGPNTQLPDQWLGWLMTTHLTDVIRAGAQSAEIVRLDDSIPHFEIRYVFESRQAFADYELHHAPRLRAEGLELFPPETGMVYQRSSGQSIWQLTGSGD